MKIKIFTLLLCVSTLVCNAQSNYFNTIDPHTHVQEVSMGIESLPDSISYSNQEPSEPTTLKQFLAGLSLQELEYLNERFYPAVSKKHTASKRKKDNAPTLRFYEGEHHPLTIMNLLAVMKEVGISNRLFVLAQSLLETGYFKSNVCKTRNNLFGLYDSRRKCYYKFDSWESSVVGYCKFIQYRYKGGNYLSFLQRIGYAEDPKYISKVCDISKKLNKMEFIVD